MITHKKAFSIQDVFLFLDSLKWSVQPIDIGYLIPKAKEECKFSGNYYHKETLNLFEKFGICKIN